LNRGGWCRNSGSRNHFGGIGFALATLAANSELITKAFHTARTLIDRFLDLGIGDGIADANVHSI